MDSCHVTVKITGKAFELVLIKQTEMSIAEGGNFKNKVPYPKVIQKLLEELSELQNKRK